MKNITVSEVNDHSKEIEQLKIKADPLYSDLLRAIEIVKNFIIEHKCIVYGGTAIDYCLRLKGDKIYPDEALALPDLDFYSPDSVNLSYDLADILSKGGWQARAISGMHAETQRVDAGDNHFIADITYVPGEIFDRLPTLTYGGMRILAPLYQRIDMHSSLSFPYDDSPREVVFARWPKDVKRFNIMNKYYPVIDDLVINKSKLEKITMNKYSVPLTFKRSLLAGHIGYAVLCRVFNDFCKAKDIKDNLNDNLKDGLNDGLKGNLSPLTLNPLTFTITATDMIYEAPINELELVDTDIIKRAEYYKLTDVKEYEKCFNLQPRKIDGKLGDKIVKLFSTEDRLVSCNSVVIDGQHIRVANIQYLLKSCIGNHFMYADRPMISTYYLLMYNNLMTMLEIMEKYGADPVDNPFFLSVNTYGADNINTTTKMQLQRMEYDMGIGKMVNLPVNYYPDRKDKPRPVAEYDKYEFFHESGHEVKK